jgi:hypothetical protein
MSVQAVARLSLTVGPQSKPFALALPKDKIRGLKHWKSLPHWEPGLCVQFVSSLERLPRSILGRTIGKKAEWGEYFCGLACSSLSPF